MARIRVYFFALVAAVVLLSGYQPARARSNLESGVLAELNLARSDPQAYEKFIAERENRFKGKLYEISHGVWLQTREGVSAVEEAAQFLKNQKPLPPLKYSEGLSEVAQDLVNIEGPSGKVGHDIENLSVVDRLRRHGQWQDVFVEEISYGPRDAREIVSQLIIDDGVKSRGHRINIFNGSFKVVGIACGPHAKFGKMCVIDFAGGFIPSARP